MSITRIAILGDAEPKPEPTFTHTASAVQVINRLDEQAPIAFVASVGDLAHKGTIAQYEAVGEHMIALRPPLLPILGNEELVAEGGAGRLLRYTAKWNSGDSEQGVGLVRELSYTRRLAGHLFVFASAMDGGKEFVDEEIDWIEAQLDAGGELSAIVFMHNAPAGLFCPERAMQRPTFAQRVLARDNVIATFSGHLHMNIDQWPGHARCARGVHHIHAPGLERTKLGSRHVPRFRLLTIERQHVTVQTYNLATHRFEPEHELSLGSDPALSR